MMKHEVDCVVVGYNDLDFHNHAQSQKRMERFSGAFRDIKHNSVLLDGRRATYMELLNEVIRSASGCDPKLNAFEVPSLGVTYLTSFLRRRNFIAEMVNFFNYEREKFADLLANSPLAVAITTTYYVEPQPLLDVIRFVRENSPATRIIVGGPHIYNVVSQYTLGGLPDHRSQDHILRSIGADIYVCDSQGEHTLVRLLEKLREARPDLSRIPNLIYTEDNQAFTRTRQEREDNSLDDDAVDWSLFRQDERIFSHPVFMRTARSCPFACTFCNFPAVAGKHVVNDLDVLERQLWQLHERGVKYINFIDDTINVPLPRFKNLLRMMIRNKFDFEWISFFRCSNADDVTFDLMRESGCREVFLGIESGAQEILNRMRKFADIDKYKNSIRKLNERGIATYESFIVGFPGETRDTVMRTIDFIEETQPAMYNVQMYYHDVRTPVHQQAGELQIQGAGYCWKHCSMTWQEAADWTDYAFAQVQSSVPTTIYGFSIWVIPYLLSRGVSFERVMDFLRVARPMLVKSLADDPQASFSGERARLEQIFHSFTASAPA